MTDEPDFQRVLAELCPMIRAEGSRDFERVRNVIHEAFGRDVEALLVDRLRGSARYIPELALVAETDEEVIGHILLTRATLDELPDERRMLVLGPIGVLPEYQRRGVGRTLIGVALRRAKELGYRGVALIGHPTYYPRFGFLPGSRFGLRTTYDVPNDVFMALALTEGSLEGISGLLHFPAEFAGV